MAYQELNLIENVISWAAIQAVCQPFHSWLSTIGWVQTADTGQIDFTAGSGSLPAISTGGAYQIWKFGDSLQSTAPYFFRFEWGGGVYDGQSLAMALTVGTATDGAGNITTQASSRMIISTAAKYLVTNLCYMSGDVDRVAFGMFDGPVGSESFFIGIDRSRNSSGTTTGTNCHVFMAGQAIATSGTSNTGAWSCSVPQSGTVDSSCGLWHGAFNQAQNSMYGASYVGTAIPIPYNVYPQGEVMNQLIYQGSDFESHKTVPLTIMGSSHTYMPLTPATQSPTNPQNGCHIMLRYE